MGGISIPYESGQSGTANPDPVEVTIAPAKIKNSVEPATSFVNRRNQGCALSKSRGLAVSCITA